jgi:hypothetical protein
MELNVKLDSEKFEQAMRDGPEIVDQHLELASIKATAALQAKVQEFIGSAFGEKPAAVCYGTLIGAIYGEPYQGPVYGGLVAVSPPADVYAACVEYGTRPHFPPVDALLPWVKKKFGTRDEGEARQIAFAIARKMSGRFTPGHHMFERAIEVMGEPVQEMFAGALGAACGEIEAMAGGPGT